MEINERIHAELQGRGIVSGAEHRIRIFVPRQDLAGADRTWAERYEVGDVLRYSRASKETGIGKGEYAQVKKIDAPANRLTVWFTIVSASDLGPSLTRRLQWGACRSSK
jgi:hypothetical protein